MVHIIYDDRTPEDYGRILGELIRQEITEFKFHPATVLKNSVVESINFSHKKIVREAKESGEKEVIIFEQDIFFTSPDSWKYFMDNKPKVFDVYLGGTYLINKPDEWAAPRIKVNEWVGSHCIIISERYYDTFLSVPDNDHIDTVQKGRGEFYVCFPFIGMQRPGHSRNCDAPVNYNHTLNAEWFMDGNKFELK